MKLKIIAKIIAKTFAVVFRRLNSYITAAIRAPQLKSTHTPKGRRLVCSKMLKISKNIVSVAIKKKTSSRQAPLRVREREKNSHWIARGDFSESRWRPCYSYTSPRQSRTLHRFALLQCKPPYLHI